MFAHYQSHLVMDFFWVKSIKYLENYLDTAIKIKSKVCIVSKMNIFLECESTNYLTYTKKIIGGSLLAKDHSYTVISYFWLVV